MKRIFTILMAAAAFLLSAAEIPYDVESMMMEGFYTSNGTLRGTEKNFNAKSDIPAKKGWNEIKARLGFSSDSDLELAAWMNEDSDE